jgi:hypothetical protein
MRTLKFDSRWAAALGVALCLACGVGPVVAQDAKAPMRWINASQVNLRDLPGLHGRVLQRLALATPVRLITQTDNPDFCEIDVEAYAHRGFVACRFLITSVPPAPAPATDAASAGLRWVIGSGVNLRSEPSLQAPIVERLALNTRVRGFEVVPGSVFCKVQSDNASGFTACQYLATEPVAVDRVSERVQIGGSTNSSYDPARSFWLAPKWHLVEEFGQNLLEAARKGIPGDPAAPDQYPEVPRPPNAEFDRMKAHMAKGIYGQPPTERLSWLEIKRLTASLLAPAATARATDHGQRVQIQSRLSSELQLSVGKLNKRGRAQASQLTGLVAALELPTAALSYFKSEADIAGPSDRVEDLSGRFHIIHTYRTKGRDLRPDAFRLDGAWDIDQITLSLVKPLVRTTIHRDGRLRGVATHASDTRPIYGQTEPPMCDGHIFGFSHGQADWPNWRSAEYAFKPNPDELRLRPLGSLLSITTRSPLPAANAKPVITAHKLNRELTGFVRGIWMHFDLDVDGVVDLAVWEGVGRGAGHLEEQPLKVDDPHHRLFFVNIDGRWKLLGSDSFSYGCGC